LTLNINIFQVTCVNVYDLDAGVKIYRLKMLFIFSYFHFKRKSLFS